MTLRLNSAVYRGVTIASDALFAIAAWVIGGYVRYQTFWLPGPDIFRAAPELVIGLYGLTLLVLLSWSGAYRFDRLRPIRADLWSAARAVAVLAVLVFAGVAALKLHSVSRLLLGYVLVAQGVLCLGGRVVMRRALSSPRLRRRSLCRMLVVGSTLQADEVIRKVGRHPELGIEFAGRLDGCGVDDVSRFVRVLREQVIDEVLVALPLAEASAQAVILACQEEGKPVHLLLGPLERRLIHSSLTSIDGTTVLSLAGLAHGSAALLVKRVLDAVFALLALIVLSPVLLLAALLIRLTSPGPVFFSQERVGLNGRRFQMVKFRSMVAGAEELKAGLEHLNEAEGPVFKIRDDPRMTAVGRLLRRANIDELPQLMNVLRGEMSLVGPRPLPTSEARECYEWNKRHSVSPGITGPWQVGGRHKLSFDEWMKLDLDYVDNWSLFLDLQIILRTVPEVLGFRGA